VAIEKLWEAIFNTTRINVDDPVSVWKQHDAELHKRAARLNEKRYAALPLSRPGTDFRLGLSDGHLWLAAERRRATAITAFPTCLRKKCSRRLTRIAPMEP